MDHLSSSDVLCFRWIRLAKCQARKLGINADDAEDCATAFVVHLLSQTYPEQSCVSISQHTDSWTSKCASNFALNFSRGLRRHAVHETLSVDTTELCERVGPESPESEISREEFWD